MWESYPLSLCSFFPGYFRTLHLRGLFPQGRDTGPVRRRPCLRTLQLRCFSQEPEGRDSLTDYKGLRPGPTRHSGVTPVDLSSPRRWNRVYPTIREERYGVKDTRVLPCNHERSNYVYFTNRHEPYLYLRVIYNR